MKRLVFRALGALELLFAVILIVLSFQLPSSDQVTKSSEEIRNLTASSAQQVEQIKKEIQTVRRPEVRQLAEQLHTEIPKITAMLRAQELSYDGLRQTRDGLREVSVGLKTFSETMKPETVKQLAKGLRTTADYLDKIGPQATATADRLEKSSELLGKDSEALSVLLSEAAPNLQSLEDLRNGLKNYGQGLKKMEQLLDVERLKTMREGFKGMEASLSKGAGQVSQLAGYNYPVVTFRGIKPTVRQQKFWPQGKTVAEGLRKGAKGLSAAGEQLDQIVKDVPDLQKSFVVSQEAAKQTEERIAKTLKNREKIEKLLKQVPESSAALAKELPKIGKDLADVLRQTNELSEVAKSLRGAQQNLELMAKSWPKVEQATAQSAKLLEQTANQLDNALDHEKEHKQSLKKVLTMTESTARLMPTVATSLDESLDQQAKSLDQLQGSLQRTSENVTPLADSASSVLQTVRWLLWLFAGIVAIHGSHLLANRN